MIANKDLLELETHWVRRIFYLKGGRFTKRIEGVTYVGRTFKTNWIIFK